MAKAPRIKATVGPFTFAYPHLTAPDTEGQYADNKYKVDGIEAPTSDAMKRAKKVVADAVKELGLPKGAMLPLKEQTAKNDKGFPEPTGDLLFRAKSQFAPMLVDSRGKPIEGNALAKLKVGAGSRGLLQGYFSTYVAAGKPGMSFTLTGVQLLSVVSNGGGAEFSAWEGEGGFTMDDDDAGGDGLQLGPDTDEDDDASVGDGGILDI